MPSVVLAICVHYCYVILLIKKKYNDCNGPCIYLFSSVGTREFKVNKKYKRKVTVFIPTKRNCTLS